MEQVDVESTVFDAGQKKLEDLSSRQITSIVFYPLVYILCFSPVVYGQHSAECVRLVQLMGLVLTIAVGIRFFVLREFKKSIHAISGKKWSQLRNVSLVMCALIWGGIASYSQVHSELSEHLMPVLAGTLALIGGGVLASCIDTKSMHLFIWSIALPPSITAFLPASQASAQIGLIILLYSVGMLWVSTLPKREYDRFVQTNIELKQVLSDQYRRSSIDWLTKVKNRSYFESALRCELERSQELGVPLSILVIDIDHFKEVNDSYGHAFGDFTLLTTAQRIENSIKHASDLVARYGGEEFCVLFPGLGKEEAFMVAERLRKDIADNSISKGNIKLNVTISIGGYSFEGDGDVDAHYVFNKADQALYDAKNSGRNKTKWAS